MRIVLIHDNSNYTIILARALGELGHRCVVLFQHRRYLPQKLENSEMLTFVECNTERLLPIIRSVVGKEGSDVYVSNCRAAWIACTMFSKLHHRIHTAILHGADIRNLTLTGRRFLRDRMLLLALSQAYRVFCSTPDLLEYRDLVGQRIHELPQPIDTGLFSPRARRLDLQGDPVILSPIRLVKHKGAMRIIRLAGLIAKENPKARIYQKRLGKPQYLELMARNVSPKQLIFWDPVSRESLPSLLVSSDLVIGQMEIGSLGCIELEAISCGVPVVVYDLYRGYGLADNRIGSLAGYSRQIIRDSVLRQKVVEAGRLLVEQLHEPRKVAARFLAETLCGEDNRDLTLRRRLSPSVTKAAQANF